MVDAQALQTAYDALIDMLGSVDRVHHRFEQLLIEHAPDTDRRIIKIGAARLAVTQTLLQEVKDQLEEVMKHFMQTHRQICIEQQIMAADLERVWEHIRWNKMVQYSCDLTEE